MTRVFVFTNHKGGVGKSTSATNTALGIAGMLRRAGAPNSRVLLIDTDSQAHTTLVTTGTKDYGVDNSLYTVLMADRQNAAQTLLSALCNRHGMLTYTFYLPPPCLKAQSVN
jgi:cellulose biosynthesis protein BcsQ